MPHALAPLTPCDPPSLTGALLRPVTVRDATVLAATRQDVARGAPRPRRDGRA